MSDSDDIAAQIAALEQQSAAQVRSREKTAEAAGSKRRQLCVSCCHHYKDDPKYLKPARKDADGKKKKGENKEEKLKHVCPKHAAAPAPALNAITRRQ